MQQTLHIFLCQSVFGKLTGRKICHKKRCSSNRKKVELQKWHLLVARRQQKRIQFAAYHLG